MKTFWIWFEHVMMLSAFIGVLAWFVACFTGSGISDAEMNFFIRALAVWGGLMAVGYIVHPGEPRKKGRR